MHSAQARALLLLPQFILACAPAAGRTLNVGPGQPYPTIAAAAAAVRPGDLVLIQPGVYREAVVWRGGSLSGAPITVRGAVAGKVVIDGAGVPVTGVKSVPRALFQVEGDNFVFEDLHLRNARNGRNAAGFRLLNAKRTVIRRCRVAWCDMGLISTANDELLVERSEIAFNGTPAYNGFSHNFYLAGGRTTVRFCYIHDSTNGQTFKTRGHYTELLYNYIADAHDRIEGGDTTKEIGFQDSPEASRPGAHAVLIGNIIVKRGAGNSFIDFGPEGAAPPRNGVLYMINNTVVRETPVAQWMLRLGHASQRAVLHNNIFTGFRDFVRGPGAANITGSNNWFPAGGSVPATLRESVFGEDPGFIDAAGRDYRLAPSSPCVNRGASGLSVPGPQGPAAPASAAFEYVAHLRSAPRPRARRASLGALEFDPARTGPASSTIRGRLAGANGTPLAGLPVLLEGPSPASVRSRPDGSYSVSHLKPGAYRINPWPFQTAIQFQPLAAAPPATVDFPAPPLHSIGGLITGRLGSPLPGVIVYLEGDGGGWTATGPDGRYLFSALPAGASYAIRPVRRTHSFTPPARQIKRLTASVTLNLAGDGTYMVHGGIRDLKGVPLGGISLTLSGGSSSVTTTTNQRGNYRFHELAEGASYRVTPSHPRYRFDPPRRDLKRVTADILEAGFKASPR